MLNSLKIKNFRLLESFQVKKLGQVNLIVGKNNSGKSSVLEALRIYAGNANGELLAKIAQGHDEKYELDEEEHMFDTTLPFEDLFTGRQFPENDNGIVIGEVDNIEKDLHINHGFLGKKQLSFFNEKRAREQYSIFEDFDGIQENVKDILIIKKERYKSIVDFNRPHLYSRRFPSETNAVPCNFIPTRFVSMNELAKEWDAIALTDGENIVKDALRIILPDFENLTFIDGDRSRNSRIAKVKISNLSKPVPLNSLGDGMLRILQLVLKVFSAKDGILLIDEFENGLHYSVQEKVWKLLFELSKDLNIQIFATTHSWDCIESFSEVAVNYKNVDGVLFRVGKSIRKSDNGRVIATVFDEEQLYNITQSDVEVR
ncbi:MAG: AAA family ATPase [Thiomargarita sp.]|nr:AAA family ATPase [Thiomargarita sp.]